jgi:hypothetical protein
VATVAGDHHGHGVAGAAAGTVGTAAAGVQVEPVGRLDQAHELAVHQDVRLPLEVADLGGLGHHDAVDPAQGEGVGLAGDLD